MNADTKQHCLKRRNKHKCKYFTFCSAMWEHMNTEIKTNTAGSGSSSPLLIAGQYSHFICANTKLDLSNRAEQPTDYPTTP